jgi:hypothetical protein
MATLQLMLFRYVILSFLLLVCTQQRTAYAVRSCRPVHMLARLHLWPAEATASKACCWCCCGCGETVAWLCNTAFSDALQSSSLPEESDRLTSGACSGLRKPCPSTTCYISYALSHLSLCVCCAPVDCPTSCCFCCCLQWEHAL